jgi:DNA segregation ATPase FtsK/SpoIIIE, S-DNA-T family
VSRTATRSKKAKKSADALAGQRRWEVLGLILMGVAALLALALVTYDARDAHVARSISWLDALLPAGQTAHNWVGLLGAKLAHGLVAGFLGFPVVALCGLLFAWGYTLFRQRESLYLPLLTGLTVALVVLVSVLLGWFADGGGGTLDLWSGSVGLGLAGWMKLVFGSVGSLLLLFTALAVTGLLFIDRDIQLTLDRAEAAVDRLRGQTAERWEEAKAAHNARVAGRAERRAAVRAEQLAARRQREEERKQREAERKREAQRPAPAPEPSPASRPPILDRTPSPPPLPSGPPLAIPPEDELLDDLVARHTPAREPSALRSKPPVALPAEPALHVQAPIEEEAGDLAARHRQQPDASALPFTFPDLALLDPPDPAAGVDHDEIEENKRVLLEKLETYNVQITEIHAVVGPTVTRYELTPAPGVRISRITALEDDLAMAMAAPGIRILAPIPGKSAIGVEIPNRHRELVRLTNVLGTARFTDAKQTLPIALGKNIQGEVQVEDLTRMPHLLIAGATGAGKSVGLNAMIVGLLYACAPTDLKFVMIDPKKIELGPYQQLLDHYIAMPEDSEDPVITDFRDAAGVLKSCEREMETRYDKLAEAGVRGIKEYNERVRTGALRTEDGHLHLPYIVVIVDELADLMMTSGKEVEPPIARLAQMARAVGIHLILATQRPSVDVITGLIKANFPSRIAFQVASKIDSRTILDGGGAEQLVGNGDLLYMNGSRIVRLQGPFVSNDEIERVAAFVAAQQGAGPYLLPPLDTESEGLGGPMGDDDERDDLFEEAARAIVRSQQGSVSLLQRKLSVGYTRAARIVDQLEDAGIVGPFEGSKARAVLVGSETELEGYLNRPDEALG